MRMPAGAPAHKLDSVLFKTAKRKAEQESSGGGGTLSTNLIDTRPVLHRGLQHLNSGQLIACSYNPCGRLIKHREWSAALAI